MLHRFCLDMTLGFGASTVPAGGEEIGLEATCETVLEML